CNFLPFYLFFDVHCIGSKRFIMKKYLLLFTVIIFSIISNSALAQDSAQLIKMDKKIEKSQKREDKLRRRVERKERKLRNQEKRVRKAERRKERELRKMRKKQEQANGNR
ncbi:MAG: hypothetical protein ICV82_05715, partial [Nitrososphaera sp.]|nr:hypothetical protein [Nitrososphaera sp.]